MDLEGFQDSTVELDLERHGTVLLRPNLMVRVKKGPDEGKAAHFDQGIIRIGRKPNNDFTLTDRTVSGSHCELRRTDAGFIFRDLGSLHGSVVETPTEQIELKGLDVNEGAKISTWSEILLGTTLLEVKVGQVSQTKSESKATRINVLKSSKDQMMATLKMPKDFLPLPHREHQFETLFQLARELNGLTRLEEIFERLATASFKAFPSGEQFSICQIEENNPQPVFVRKREPAEDEEAEIFISSSILKRVMESGESVHFIRDPLDDDTSQSIVQANISSCICAPLTGQKSLMGFMQIDTRDRTMALNQDDLNLFSVFASIAAFAMERAGLTENIYRMFESFAQASVWAIEARDPITAGHSERVAKYTVSLAECVNETLSGPFGKHQFNQKELTELRYAALLHDFGKVGVREAVLMKRVRIEDTRMELIARHFENLKLIYRQVGYAQMVKEAMASHPPTPQAYQAFQHSCAQFELKLNAHLAFLRSCLGIWKLEPPQRNQIEQIGRQFIVNLDGQKVFFLTENEINDLCIPVGTLNEKEWEDMRSHVSQSEAFLEKIPWTDDLKQVPCIAGAHHEKLDGSGYPRGLRAAQLNCQARILTITDIFDAVTAWDRPYHTAFSLEKAGDLLKCEAAAGRLDCDLVEIFLSKALGKIAHLIPRHGQA